MQKAYISSLYELVSKDQNVISLLSDSGTMFDEKLAHDYPKQCLNFGIAEEHFIGAASGLASCGKIPFAYTSGAFLAYRAYEFIRDDVCFQNRNVKIIGMGSGVSWSTLGPSHHTTEDISVLRSLPNLVFLSPASPLEVSNCVNAAYDITGPVYIRLGMSNEREIYDGNYEFTVGKNIILRDGSDVTIFSTGSIISEVLSAAEQLSKMGIEVQVINVHSLKPFDKESVLKAAKVSKLLVSVEDHSIFGGLGGIIAEVLCEFGVGIRLERIGLCNMFAKGYGTENEVRRQNGLDSESIVNRVLRTYAEVKNR